jgi:hypothetical protein
MPSPPSHAELVILTGDLVGSSRLDPSEIDAAMAALERASAEVMRQWGEGPARFTRYRGDGWQCIGPPPRLALRAALLFRAHLGALGRSFDTRISVGIGPGTLPADTNLTGAVGVAFELSGRTLDRMPHAPRFAVAWDGPPPHAVLVQAIFALCDEISRHWTPRQAQVLVEAIGPRARPSQEALADRFGVTQQVIARHLAGGGDWALRQALEAIEGGA